MANIQIGIKHKHHQISLAKALPGGLHHGAVELAPELGDARCIHKNYLRVIVGQNANNLIAGGLRLWCDNGHLLPQHGIEQG